MQASWRPEHTSSRCNTDFFDQTAQHLIRIEILLGDSARSAGVLLIIVGDQIGASHSFIQRVKCYQSLAYRKRAAEAGIFSKYWPSAGKITGASIAEPSSLELRVDWL